MFQGHRMTAYSFTYQQLPDRSASVSSFDTSVEAAQHHISLFDRDGQFYGLERKMIAELFTVFLLKNELARVELIVHDAAFIEKRCPRLIPVIRRFAPRFTVGVTEDSIKHFARGFAVFDETAVIRRPHFDRAISYWDTDEHAIGQARELMEQLRRQSNPALQQPTGL